MVILVAVTVPAVLLIFFSFCYIYITRRKFREEEDESKQEDMEDLPFFNYITIVNATNGFSKKLGEGGFGPVYKGTLADGQEWFIVHTETLILLVMHGNCGRRAAHLN
ncbi:hypothetical protein L6164_018537 [Bauhinia variegata]|uniref:Uncharacterized protein n=1 Tax=Bauhinia variegata TaxID=167791 RepID=A0ACB9NC19_BAUVA|nr:hypothetical protein L6164_018537 [Bauhinia variegata]